MWRLPAEYASAPIFVRTAALLGEVRREGGAACMPLQPPRLRVQAADRGELFVIAELRLADRALQHADRLVVDLERDREGVAVLAAVSEGEAGRVGEAARGGMDDFGDHGERTHRARADAGDEEQVGEVPRAGIGGGGERAVE